MSNMLSLHPYEISLWEDVLVKKNKYDEATKSVVVDSYFEERKIAILGSNTMDTPIRAHNPQYIKNINGSSTLVFTLYYQYYDNDKEEIVRNPFVDLLFNERKIKLRFEEEGREDCWHDFIIKDIQEDSTKYTYTYTATDLFINELAKNGFKLEFDTDLENNNGSHTELARQILKETDWNVIPTKEELENSDFEGYKNSLNGEYSDLLRQKKVEPLYEIQLSRPLKAILCDPIRDKGFPKDITIPAGEIILLFHNTVEIEAIDNRLVQFIYRKDGNYKVDSEYVIVNAPNYQLASDETISWNNGIPNFTNTAALLISERYSGERLVWNVSTDTDLVLGEHVIKYRDSNNKTYNGYTKSEYVVSSMVQSFVTNGKNFTGLEGWKNAAGGSVTSGIAPDPHNYNASQIVSSEIKFTPYLKIDSGTVNTGFLDHAKEIRTIGAGETYVIKADFETNTDSFISNTSRPVTNESIKIKVIKGDRVCLESEPVRPQQYVKATFNSGLSFSDLTDAEEPVLIQIECNKIIYLVSLEIFKYEEDVNGNMVEPGEPATAKVNTKYYIYDPDANKDKKPEEYVYSYIGYNPKEANFYQKYDNTFNKIRSITASKSNRFNLIQEVCETFECWADFVINHDKDGRIKRSKEGYYEKFVIFKEFIGQENNRGFRYGINLNGIQRTIDSDQIVTKLIVEQNSNEYGKNGCCTIARAVNNVSGDNAIYDFSYYTNTGLLNTNEVNNDLYGYINGEPVFDTDGKKIISFKLTQPQGYLGYFSKLSKYNSYVDGLTEQQSALGTSIMQLESQKQTLDVEHMSYDTKYADALDTFEKYLGVSYEKFLTDSTIANEIKIRINKDPKALDLLTAIQAFDVTNNYFNNLYGAAEQELKEAQKLYDITTENLKFIENLKLELNKQFYEKYSRFIQEGSWISEDYYDDEWYYFDALSVLRTSAQPQVTYTINVIDLASLEEYSNYQFAIGDKTYVEDVEFFGYSNFNTKTPFRKEVVVSEVTWNLDSPEQNQIKVQNYKTQFEDLFQRITATTQAVQYSTGSYARAASIVNNNGTINSETLQNSFDNNSIIIANARDQSVVWNESGISITNLRNPNQVVRLVSNGILLSTDGGSTWKTGISANGINTKYLTAGQIDVSKINIIGGDGGSGFSSFRWDSKGLTSYWWDDNGYDFNRFTRFDRFGLYGITKSSVDDFDLGLSDTIKNAMTVSEKRQAGLNFIKQNSDFGVTWDGFFIKSNHRGDANPNSGHIEITPQDDFRVLDNEGRERIRIGLLGFNETTGRPIYGMRLSGVSGDDSSSSTTTMPILESLSDGSLFLQNKMVIGPRESWGYNPRVEFGIVNTWRSGYGDLVKNKLPNGFPDSLIPSSSYSKILAIRDLNGNENIRIYDTGLLWAQNAYIEGHIEATSGKIGNLDVKAFENSFEGITVESKGGFILKHKSDGLYEPDEMAFKPIAVGAKSFSWYYKNPNGDDFIGGSDGSGYWNTRVERIEVVDPDTGEFSYIDTDGTLPLTAIEIADKFDSSGIFTLKVKADLGYETTVIISLIEEINIEDIDIDSDIYEIRLSTNEILKFYNSSNRLLQYSPESFYIYGVKTKGGIATYLDNTTEQKLDVLVRVDDQYVGLRGTFFEQFIKYDEINKRWFFNSSELFKIYSDEELAKDNAPITGGNLSIYNILTSSNANVLFFRIVDSNSNIFTENRAVIRYGNGDESATLSLNATDITAAINNQKLSFSANGLSIYNSGFSIEKTDFINESEKLLYFDENTGDLFIKGSGEFGGIVKATGGEFNGDINTYGNIVLNERDGNIGNISSANFTPGGKEGFKIDGKGDIIANSIKLGTGAEIERYLKFKSHYDSKENGGDFTSWLFNPEYSEETVGIENAFILLEKNETTQTTDENGKLVFNQEPVFILTTDGILKIGKKSNYIEMNGLDQTIQSSNYNSTNSGWKISNNNSIFNHITATKATIESSVFKYGDIQAVGGILIVRPSSNIKTITKIEGIDNEYIIELEEAEGFETNGYCFFEINGEKEYLFIKEGKNNNNNNNITVITNFNLKDNESILIGKPIIDVGSQDSVGIGINSSSNKDTVKDNSISVFQTNITKSADGNIKINLTPKIIMGYFDNKDDYENTGLINSYGKLKGKYGLYAENVLVTGAIISDDGNGYNAGLDTNSDASMGNIDDVKDFFPDAENLGRIVLWAGARGSGKEAIEAAKFKVDCYGNLYANSGFFNGTIITNSHIGASEFNTPEITGNGKNTNPNGEGLIIRDANNGIYFNGTGDAVPKLKIEEDAVSIGDIPFDSKTIFIHRPDSEKEENKISTLIKDNQFNYVKEETFYKPKDPQNLEKREENDWNYLSSIYYDNNIKIGKDPIGNENYFSFGELKDDRTKNISNITMEIQENLILGRTDETAEREIMHYEKKTNGYDLFVLKE